MTQTEVRVSSSQRKLISLLCNYTLSPTTVAHVKQQEEDL